MDSVSSIGETDRISGLPDDVLSHILSLLPLQDAIQSTLLLKRFRNLRNLWRSFSKLNLDTYSTVKWTDPHHDTNDKNSSKIFHHILIYHDKVEIEELCLRHYFYFEYSKDPEYSMNPSPEIQNFILEEKRFASVIDSLVNFAMIKKCKVLTLDFIDTGVTKEILHKEYHELQQGYLLPTIVYRSIHLTQLSLGNCDITSCDEVCLKSLKLLRFLSVAVSDEAMQKFMSGCPLLEELSFVICYGLHNLCCSSVKLKKLEIDHWELYSLTVSNINVVFLKISGMFLQNVVLLNSNVVDAQVYSRDMMVYEMRPYEGFKFLLQSLDQCKTFSACLWTLKVFAIWELTNIPCPYFKWTNLVLDKLWLTSCVQVGLSTLLRHVPLLRTLKIHTEPRPNAEFPAHDQKIRLEEKELDDEEKYWDEAKANLENLKTVVIHGSCITTEPGVIRVAKFLLRNAVALEKMIVSTKNYVGLNDSSHSIFTSSSDTKPETDGSLADGLRCILEKLVASPKASTKAMICFI